MRQATQPHRRIIKSNNEGSDGTVNSVKSESGSTGGESSQHRQFLGTPHDAIPQVDLSVDAKDLPEGITADDVNTFDTMYKEHCEVTAQLPLPSSLCRGDLRFTCLLTFSGYPRAGCQSTFQLDRESLADVLEEERCQVSIVLVRDSVNVCGVAGLMNVFTCSVDESIESKLPKEKLMKLASLAEVQEFVKEADYNFYQALVEVLIPNVLRHIPSELPRLIGITSPISLPLSHC